MLLALDTLAQRITVNKSTILHHDAMLALFATQTVGKGEKVVYFYES